MITCVHDTVLVGYIPGEDRWSVFMWAGGGVCREPDDPAVCTWMWGGGGVCPKPCRWAGGGVSVGPKLFICAAADEAELEGGGVVMVGMLGCA